jgi:TPR repeat protein
MAYENKQSVVNLLDKSLKDIIDKELKTENYEIIDGIITERTYDSISDYHQYLYKSLNNTDKKDNDFKFVMLGRMYYNGSAVDQSDGEAEKNFIKALKINNKNSYALVYLGMIQYNTANYKEEINFYRKAELFNNHLASVYLGLAYVDEKYCEIDIKSSKKNLHKALEIKKTYDTFYNLGYFYEYYDVDYELSLNYYIKAYRCLKFYELDKQCESSARILEIIKRDDVTIIIKSNEKKNISINVDINHHFAGLPERTLKSIIDNALETANYDILENIICETTYDTIISYQHYLFVCLMEREKTDFVLTMLGSMYYYGTVCELSIDKAEEYYLQALEINDKNSYALTYLGFVNRNKDKYEEQKEFYKKAESLNNPIALSEIGIMYGGVNMDLEREYYEKSIRIKPNYHNLYNLGFFYNNSYVNYGMALDFYIKAYKNLLYFELDKQKEMTKNILELLQKDDLIVKS